MSVPGKFFCGTHGGPPMPGRSKIPVRMPEALPVWSHENDGFRLRGVGCWAYAERLVEVSEVRVWVDEACRETGRESGHERDSIRDRRVVEDLRAPAV